jgi:hypothetical protein
MGMVSKIVSIKGPEKPNAIIRLRPVPKSANPMTPTHTQPVDGRGLKIFFEFMVCFSRDLEHIERKSSTAILAVLRSTDDAMII